jgi:SAM-dependent methyltransferase
LFDSRLRALRRDRAFRAGPELFLHERAFADILDRLSLVRRRFERALLVGCPDPGWRNRLATTAQSVEVVEPGPMFAEAAGGTCAEEDKMEVAAGSFDLCVAVGTLDSVNDLPAALLTVRQALANDSLFIGALAGGESLPQLRAAMRAADQQMGAASPHVHPRIDGPTLAALLLASGFVMPVVDVDKVDVAFSSFNDLVRDLRGMGATNVLEVRSASPLTRQAASAAADHFARSGQGGRTLERFELLHFAAWTAAERNEQS